MKSVAEEDDDVDDSDYSYASEITDDMSRLTMDTGDDMESEFGEVTVLSKQTGYKSTRFRSGDSVISNRKSRRHSTSSLLSVSHKKSKKFNVRGLTSIGLPYILDIWGNREPRNACSLQIWWLSGEPKPTVRVSTDQDEIVIDILLPVSATDPMIAFGSYLKNKKNKDFIDQLVEYHPKSIARTRTVAKLCNRDNKNPQIWLSQRIQSPFRLDYHYATKKADPLFYGTRWVDYENDGTRWLHIELVAQQKDCYKGSQAVPEEYYHGVKANISGDEASAGTLDEEASGNLMSNATTFTATETGGTKRAAEAVQAEDEEFHDADNGQQQKKKKKNSLDSECKSLGRGEGRDGVARRLRSSGGTDDVTL